MDKIFINIQEENEMIRELFKDKGSTSFVTLDEVFDKIEDLLGDIERLKDKLKEYENVEIL